MLPDATVTLLQPELMAEWHHSIRFTELCTIELFYTSHGGDISYTLLITALLAGPIRSPADTPGFPSVNLAYLRSCVRTIGGGKDALCVVVPNPSARASAADVKAKRFPPATSALAALVFINESDRSEARDERACIRGLLNYIMVCQSEEARAPAAVHPGSGSRRAAASAGYDEDAAAIFRAIAAGVRLFRESDQKFAARLNNAAEQMMPVVATEAYAADRARRAASAEDPAARKTGTEYRMKADLLSGLEEFCSMTQNARAKKYLKMLTGAASAGPEHAAALEDAGTLVMGWQQELRTSPGMPQTAAMVRHVTERFLRRYRLTRDSRYAKLAGLAAAWLNGCNDVRQVMYDPASGYCRGSILPDSTVREDSAVTGTINALFLLSQVEHSGAAVPYYHYGKFRTGEAPGLRYAVYRGGEDEECTLVVDMKKKEFRFYEGTESMKLRFR